MSVVQMVFAFVRSLVRDRAELAAENLVLRQQLAVLHEKTKRPSLRQGDRIFWAILSRLGQLAFRPTHRTARHRAPLASSRLQDLLALEVRG